MDSSMIQDVIDVVGNGGHQVGRIIPDFDALCSDETGSYAETQCHYVMRSLGDFAKATFLEFENAVASNISTTPFAGGGIHHLTRYVMNYIEALSAYSDTLNVLLKDHETEAPNSLLHDMSAVNEKDSIGGSSSSCVSPIAAHLISLTSILERNLDDKSRLYNDSSLGHLFLMNNMHYMSQTVQASKLRSVFGDEWVRKCNWKFQQAAMCYERATWSSILSLLRDEGLQNLHSNSVLRTLSKERLRGFYLAFEDVYKSQTGWSVPDTQLRDDLHISASLKVVQAYRMFVRRHTNHVSDRHIKYNADDLENYIMDLFEGSPRSLHSFHRR
ncbi:hypothetical protein RJ639_005605 [Escallonia herrerae]|uniref:Exocyst subunit Exo70 family protein n=1 Tax=Escallonia herrerae TaxID=1293975 RepID=A0AA88VT97_9ASTE|nr:hypothetical protein RJ639_005605 [Escallonia herrerae]